MVNVYVLNTDQRLVGNNANVRNIIIVISSDDRRMERITQQGASYFMIDQEHDVRGHIAHTQRKEKFMANFYQNTCMRRYCILCIFGAVTTVYFTYSEL
jgi:hypothetical protein